MTTSTLDPIAPAAGHEARPAVPARTQPASYLRDRIYGGIDGAVTTFAVICGVEGADRPLRIVLILGLANLVADGFSMAAGNFSSTRAERDEYALGRARLAGRIDAGPGAERARLRAAFAARGFSDAELDSLVAVLTARREGWIETAMADELGLPAPARSPLRAALATFTAFAVCGLVPLGATVLGASFGVVVVATLAVFFVIGSARSRWAASPWWRSGLETLLVGGLAAAFAYGVGVLLSDMGG